MGPPAPSQCFIAQALYVQPSTSHVKSVPLALSAQEQSISIVQSACVLKSLICVKCSTHAVSTTTVFKSHNSLEAVKRMLAALWSRVSESEASQMSGGFLGGYHIMMLLLSWSWVARKGSKMNHVATCNASPLLKPKAKQTQLKANIYLSYFICACTLSICIMPIRRWRVSLCGDIMWM